MNKTEVIFIYKAMTLNQHNSKHIMLNITDTCSVMTPLHKGHTSIINTVNMVNEL